MLRHLRHQPSGRRCSGNVVATLATGVSLVLGLPAAYSIAKYRQGKIGILVLIARMTPFVSYLLPWYIIFRYLHLIDSYTALTVTHLIITMPMVIWLMVSFFQITLTKPASVAYTLRTEAT